MSSTFAPIDRELLRRLPKAELHCHLDGSVRPATLLELAREYDTPMPRSDPQSLRDYMRASDVGSLEAYLDRFAVTLSVMQTAEALERVAYELAEDAAADGVCYIEVRYAPILNLRAGLSLGDVVEASLRGLARAERDHGTIGRVILCALRHLDPDISMEIAELATAYRTRGVVGFDLAGAEAAYPAAHHARAFAYAHAHGLACTCHAGEGAGAESVREAVHVCGADRLGHAARLAEDASLTDYVGEHRIPLEICLTSNVQTGAAPSYDHHPARQYFDHGLNVVLNTDNRLMSDTTLTDEYALAAEKLGFTLDELCVIALNGFESAFLSLDERHSLVERARDRIAAWQATARS
ncbi:MAG: adenosine deaminase [Gemmatimonadaceae bacterium]